MASARRVHCMHFGSRLLDLSLPHVMGILNVTPDSFSDGGELLEAGRPILDRIIDRAAGMVAAGASFLDIGGESTRPGAPEVAGAEELARVIPVVSALSARFDVVISVDTSRPEVMSEAVLAGAGLINDVRALTKPGAAAAVAATGVAVCLMHMQGQPATMQAAPQYQAVVEEVRDFLRARIAVCLAAGIPFDRLLVDPGFGFGKTLEHNLQLLAGLAELQVLGAPLLVGLSRKRMLGVITGKPERERLAAGLAAAVFAMEHGARIIRTHDVPETVDAARLCRAIMQSRKATGRRP